MTDLCMNDFAVASHPLSLLARIQESPTWCQLMMMLLLIAAFLQGSRRQNPFKERFLWSILTCMVPLDYYVYQKNGQCTQGRRVCSARIARVNLSLPQYFLGHQLNEQVSGPHKP